MTDKDKAAWSGLWFWGALGVFLICTTFGLVLFGIYRSYFPNISGVRDDWNVFGALLGGFGSCIGAVATLATLLFLAHQNRKQQDFIEWQVKTQTFEQFLNHRKVFGERLGEIQSRYDHKIRFPEADTLYLGLFPNNGPANVDLVVKPESSEDYENLLGRLKTQFERLDSLLEKAEWSEAEAYGLATHLFELVSDLGFEWIGEPSDGDIIKGTFHTGINIYSLHEALRRMKQVYNVYLRFTGNPEFDGLNRGVSRFVSEALMQCGRLRRFVVYRSIPGLSTLQNLYFEICSLRDDSLNWLLPETYRLLESTFESREDVAQLNDVDHYVYILGLATQEVRSALLKLDEDDQRYARLKACRDSFYLIFDDIRKT
ncbi:dDENN domain protein [Pseudomonas fluorescens]|uniref:DDENN domain protein n=1 Tax=Pseudomonas fluorescens TaxID=294 RepID=A0A0P9BDC7_PSEFL|nr:hypothetical protein [Pseudomonas fluorescens]KPU61015.1 dDENN domain protein [Pseudomonas fluorescens]